MKRLLFTYFLGKIIYLWKGEPYIVYRRNNVNFDDIEGLSDMIVQSELYHDFRSTRDAKQ